MTINDKKNHLLALLNSTSDNALINEVYELLNPGDTSIDVNIRELSLSVQEKINKAMDDYKNGNYITHDEMKQKIQQWITK